MYSMSTNIPVHKIRLCIRKPTLTCFTSFLYGTGMYEVIHRRECLLHIEKVALCILLRCPGESMGYVAVSKDGIPDARLIINT